MKLQSLFFSCLFLRKQGVYRQFEIESFRLLKDYYVIKLKGIDSIDEGHQLVGQEVWLPEKKLEPLAEGDYYLFQIIGCQVVSRKNQIIGKVEDFLFIKDNNLLVVGSKTGEKLIPFSQDICIEINLKERKIVIDPPQGLLDLNEI
ncbi:MAG: ribosome maturation factor RimM [Candidatus Aminicenantales bacterium]